MEHEVLFEKNKHLKILVFHYRVAKRPRFVLEIIDNLLKLWASWYPKNYLFALSMKIKDPKLDDLLNEEPYIIFTSPSCFDAFNNLYETRKTKLISIGKTTTSYIESKGFETTTTARMQTYEGISQAIIDFFKKNT